MHNFLPNISVAAKSLAVNTIWNF